MRNQFLILLFSSYFVATKGWAGTVLPSWVLKGPMSDSKYFYVICSHEGLDPEEVKQIAESKCLAGAAKLGGVNVKITQKTIQSLTGVDSSEVAEIQPLERNIQCLWTDRYLETIQNGYRLWLRCKVNKNSIDTKNPIQFSNSPNVKIDAKSSGQYKRARLELITVPQVDKVIVIGSNGERVIEVSSNVLSFELNEGDSKILVKKSSFRDAELDLPPWKHGESISHTIRLERSN